MGWEDERKRRNEVELIPDVGGCEREMGISDNAEARRTVQDRMTIVCAVALSEGISAVECSIAHPIPPGSQTFTLSQFSTAGSSSLLRHHLPLPPTPAPSSGPPRRRLARAHRAS